ncbi:MAG TPA: AAA family ATPase [Gemmatimonadales bacterium]|nr:AAA family ATPase [Gemmatimonadales bacterium]
MGDLFVKALKLKRSQVPSFKEYPFSIPAIHHLEELRLGLPVTFFIGENGTGKSTLLEAIAVCAGFNAEGGSRNFRFATRETHSSLTEYLQLVRSGIRPRDGYFLRAESFYNVASAADDYGVTHCYGGQSLHTQSHGESFMALVLNRLRGKGLYFFDEPESALSPTRQLSLMAAMQNLVDKGSQFVIATHSPILLGFPGAEILLFDSGPIKPIAYQDTEHYVVTRAFLERPDRMLRELMGSDGEAGGD